MNPTKRWTNVRNPPEISKNDREGRSKRFSKYLGVDLDAKPLSNARMYFPMFADTPNMHEGD